jgi:hypothetical protein
MSFDNRPIWGKKSTTVTRLEHVSQMPVWRRSMAIGFDIGFDIRRMTAFLAASAFSCRISILFMS